jgi:hypothetical protein
MFFLVYYAYETLFLVEYDKHSCCYKDTITFPYVDTFHIIICQEILLERLCFS